MFSKLQLLSYRHRIERCSGVRMEGKRSKEAEGCLQRINYKIEPKLDKGRLDEVRSTFQHYGHGGIEQLGCCIKCLNSGICRLYS